MLATANFSTMSNYSSSVYSQDSSSDFDSRCSTPSTDSHHRVSIGETQGTDINEERRPSNFSLPFRGLLFPQPPFDEDFDNNKSAFERNSQYEVADIGMALAVPNPALQDTLDAAAQKQKTSHLADTLAALTSATPQPEHDDAEAGPTVAELSPAEPSPIPSPQVSTSFSVFPAQNRHHRSSTVSTAIFNPRQDAPPIAGQSPPTSPTTQTPPGFSYESVQTPRCRASTVGLENLRLDLSLIRSALQEDEEDNTTQSTESTPLSPTPTKSRVLSFAQARIQRRKSSMMSADGLIPRLISASRKATLVQRRKSSAASSEGLDSDRTSSPASTKSHAHWNAEKTTKPAAVVPSSPTQTHGFSFAPAKGFNRHRRQSSEVSPDTPAASAATTAKSRDGSSQPSRRRSSKRSLSWSRAFDKTRSSSSSAKTPPPDQPPSSLPRSRRPSSVPRMSFSRLFDTTTNHHPFTKVRPEEPKRAAEPGPSVLLFSRPYDHHSTTGGIMAVSGSPAAAGGSGPRASGRHRKTVSFSLPSPVAEEPPMSFRRRFASLGSVLGQFEGGSYTPAGADGSGRRLSIGNGVASLFGGGGGGLSSA